MLRRDPDAHRQLRPVPGDVELEEGAAAGLAGGEVAHSGLERIRARERERQVGVVVARGGRRGGQQLGELAEARRAFGGWQGARLRDLERHASTVNPYLGTGCKREYREIVSALPYIDEHAVTIGAGRAETWAALERMLESASGPRFARMLGCTDTSAAGPRPFASGSAVPGFHVVAAEAPARLALAGHHHFSDYALTFHLDEPKPGTTVLRAESHARFPGPIGALYRLAVIRSGAHVLATRGMLSKVMRAAEKR